MPGDAGEEAGEIAVVRMTATRGQRIGIFALTVISAVAGLVLIVVAAVTRPGFYSNAGVVGTSLLIVAAVGLPSDNSLSRRDFASQYAVVLGYWQEVTGRASQDSAADGSVPNST